MTAAESAAAAAAAAAVPASAVSATALVRMESVAAAFGVRPVFSGATATISRGLVYAVVGPTGCGKTTLLNLLAGLIPPADGRIVFSNNADRRRVALIPQDYGLFPWKTVWRNVIMGIEIRHKRRPSTEQARSAVALMAELGIADLVGRWPSTLSGGQKQRTAIARAMAVEPALLLMDEPFNALDADIREELQELLRGLPSRHNAAIVIVTHDISEALKVADHILNFQVADTATSGFRLNCLANDPARRSELHDQLRASLRAARRNGEADES